LLDNELPAITEEGDVASNEPATTSKLDSFAGGATDVPQPKEGKSLAGDPQTGQIDVKYQQPALIPAQPLAGDATQTDWETWGLTWDETVLLMADVQSLEKLKTLNKTLLANLERQNPPKYNWCMEAYTKRFVALGGVEQAA